MVCTYCGGKTKVNNSRLQKRSNQVWRRRQCTSCRAIFTTQEAIDLSSTLIVDAEGATQPFLEDKLYVDIQLALKDRSNSYAAAREATHTIIQELLKLPQKPQFKPADISRVAGAVLSRLDRRAALRYAAEHPSLQV